MWCQMAAAGCCPVLSEMAGGRVAIAGTVGRAFVRSGGLCTAVEVPNVEVGERVCELAGAPPLSSPGSPRPHARS